MGLSLLGCSILFVVLVEEGITFSNKLSYFLGALDIKTQWGLEECLGWFLKGNYMCISF